VEIKSLQSRKTKRREVWFGKNAKKEKDREPQEREWILLQGERGRIRVGLEMRSF